MFLLMTRTNQPRVHNGRPGNSSCLRDELSPRRLRKNCVSDLKIKKKKTAIVSSHRKLALSEALQFRLEEEESVKTQTVGLGVDVGTFWIDTRRRVGIYKRVFFHFFQRAAPHTPHTPHTNTIQHQHNITHNITRRQTQTQRERERDRDIRQRKREKGR